MYKNIWITSVFFHIFYFLANIANLSTFSVEKSLIFHSFVTIFELYRFVRLLIFVN